MVVVGKGVGTISDAEVSRPLPLKRQVYGFGSCCPIPRPPWLGFVAEKPQNANNTSPVWKRCRLHYGAFV